MDTREQIIQLADTFIREKGYNAFSFYDISRSVGIKTASIHYHFPAKSDLGVAVIEQQLEVLNSIREQYKNKTAVEKLERFFSIYSTIQKEGKVCLVGSLATDFNTLDKKVKTKLKQFSDAILEWVSSFLEEGRKNKEFRFEGPARTRAILLIGSMLSIVQLSRLTSEKDFKLIKDSIKQELSSK